MATVVPIRATGPAAVTGVDMRTGIGVVRLSGYLNADAAPACCAAIGGLLRRRPRTIVLDLSATVDGPASCGFLAILAAHVRRHGAQLWLAAVPAGLRKELTSGRPGGAQEGYRIMPSVDVAAQFAREEAAQVRRPPPGVSLGDQGR